MNNKKFWDKVNKCKHNINPNYFITIKCGTPYCSGNEVHCLDCHAYIIECGCGFLNGMSGWPEKRWRKVEDDLRMRSNRPKGGN